jgi:hypothetical protein
VRTFLRACGTSIHNENSYMDIICYFISYFKVSYVKEIYTRSTHMLILKAYCDKTFRMLLLFTYSLSENCVTSIPKPFLTTGHLESFWIQSYVLQTCIKTLMKQVNINKRYPCATCVEAVSVLQTQTETNT